MSEENTTTTATSIKPKSSYKKKFMLFGLAFMFLFVIGTGIYVKYWLFKVKAEGIALGYAKAALAAYQMGRPIPDTIFEEDSYRVEIKSDLMNSGKSLNLTISVRDKYTNITHYEYSKSANQALR